MEQEVLTTLQQWQHWTGEGFSMLPYVVRHPLAQGEDRPLTWQRAWRDYPASFVLESGKSGRYTFLGLEPIEILEGKDQRGLLKTADGQAVRLEGKPLRLLEKWMKPYRSPRLEAAPKFLGGCVGYFSYDIVRSLEKLPRQAKDDLPIPDYVFMRFEEVWVIDHRDRSLFCVVHHSAKGGQTETSDMENAYLLTAERAQAMKKWWDDTLGKKADQQAEKQYRQRVELWENLSYLKKQQVYSFEDEFASSIQPVFPKQDFIAAVHKIQNYIAEGDVFQVNLSVRQSKPLLADPTDIYEWLRILNPSPYMGLLRLPHFQMVSASPELLVQLEGATVRTRPIAGTRRRGANPEEDEALARELIENEKERAEHIMLVDLLRNDLGRVSEYGTVKVDELMVIESYSHVMHIVSEVKGQLAKGKSLYDVIASIFPGGTITGAPKIRTMEIVEELEPVRRGPYTGSLGWIDYNGNMELNIIIRTLLAVQGTAHVQAGAGIVIDSVPEKEYEESLNKAKALWKAIELSEWIVSSKDINAQDMASTTGDLLNKT
ncbi:anthranilate synthase component I family protein [Paenibacillus senegalensis]|uniref:anthranilate synthase component I family protein n=1 Tax=Paenibacillus senegalensis TaxID=1465766 RepID=UPI000289FBF3|nr:anthranilate synthase component I family protein [Paenibacillus senegalensis]